jgi:hypothetical protein
VFAGAAAPTMAVGPEWASAEPTAFEAVTLTRMVDPTSEDVSL